MFGWTINETRDGTLVRLEGCVDAHAEVELTRLGQSVKANRLVLDCGGIAHINSIGVALWTEFLQSLPARARVEFHNCSAFFIDYVNLVPCLIEGGRVVSFQAPLACGRCQISTTVLLQADEVDPATGFGTHLCERCRSPLTPEVSPADFFGFLSGSGDMDES